MKSSKLTALISGIVAMAATVILYILIFDDIFAVTMQWLSMTFLLISEAIVTIKAMLTQKDIISQVCVWTGLAHTATVLALSLPFIVCFPSHLKTYILLNILIIALLAAVDVIIWHFAKTASAGDKKLAQSQGVMDACYAKAQGLAVIYGQGEQRKDLLDIAELIKYADNSELTGDESEIMTRLEALEAELKAGGEGVPALIDEAKSAIKLRSIKMKNIKKGGY